VGKIFKDTPACNLTVCRAADTVCDTEEGRKRGDIAFFRRFHAHPGYHGSINQDTVFIPVPVISGMGQV
jgi:hypothetical protein